MNPCGRNFRPRHILHSARGRPAPAHGRRAVALPHSAAPAVRSAPERPVPERAQAAGRPEIRPAPSWQGKYRAAERPAAPYIPARHQGDVLRTGRRWLSPSLRQGGKGQACPAGPPALSSGRWSASAPPFPEVRAVPQHRQGYSAAWFPASPPCAGKMPFPAAAPAVPHSPDPAERAAIRPVRRCAPAPVRPPETRAHRCRQVHPRRRRQRRHAACPRRQAPPRGRVPPCPQSADRTDRRH